MIQSNTSFLRVANWLIGGALSIIPPTTIFGAGTIAPGTPNIRVQWYTGSGSATIPVPTSAQVVYGVFWKAANDPSALFTLSLPLGSNSTTTAGAIIGLPTIYSIPGTEAGQSILLQIRAWPSSYGTNWMAAQPLGQTSIINVSLGTPSGPGTVIWQSTSGTDPDRFYPLTLNVPPPPPVFVTFGMQPNPSMFVDEGSHGVIETILRVNRFANGPISNLDTPSTVLVSTSDATAKAGQDYAATNVLVTFGPGETQQQVTLTITSDSSKEPEEQFNVRLIPTSGVVGTLFSPLVVTIREAQIISVREEGTASVVTFGTTSTQRYALETSEDLVAWTPVVGAENVTGTGQTVEVIHPCPGDCPMRFYRARILP